jgi:hypothetical protein
MFIMMAMAKRKEKAWVWTYQTGRCVVERRVAELPTFVRELFRGGFSFRRAGNGPSVYHSAAVPIDALTSHS